MMDWLSRCWGGVGVTSTFERARITCTYADWSLPDQEALAIVIGTFKGENKDMEAEAAINSFLAHLEQDEQRRNAAFLLKNLLILDFAVEERVFLAKVGSYHNNQLLCAESGANQQISSSVRDLIAHYFEYIRNKARIYSTQAMELVKKADREKFMQASTTIQMLNEINICFKIQNSILMVSDCFMNGNKSPQIIQIIFSSLLKTYLFCFSIVSLALKTFISRIHTLSKPDLQYLARLAAYFNKDYTRNFLLFVERNKVIENFRTLKYNQLIIMDEKVLTIVQNRLQELEQEAAPCPQPAPLSLPFHSELIVEKDGLGIEHEIESEVQVGLQPRRKIDTARQISGNEDEPAENFTQYVNFYNEGFIIEDQEAHTPGGTLLVKKTEAEKKKKSARLQFPQESLGPDLSRDMRMQESKKFDKQLWERWPNVYCH